MRRAQGRSHTYTVFEDENNRWYIVSGTDLAVIKSSLGDKVQTAIANRDLIDRGPGRVFEDESKEVRLADIVKEDEEFKARFTNGETMKLTPTEVKTLFLFS